MLAPMNDANHPMPHILSRRCLAAALVLVLVAGCGSSAPRPASTPSAPRPPIALPGTPAGAQARWLLAASAHLPIAAAVLAGHFDRRFLARISPGALNGALASVGAALPGSGRVRVDSIQVDNIHLAPRANEEARRFTICSWLQIDAHRHAALISLCGKVGQFEVFRGKAEAGEDRGSCEQQAS